MKILHTSDWHLGKFVSVQSMIDDQRYFIEHVFLPALDAYAPDVIVLAGDIYDRRIAPVPAIELFEQTLYAAADRGISLLAISGNHDSAERLIPGARLMWGAGIYLANGIEYFLEPISITTPDGSKARFFLLPYCDITQVRHYLGREDLKDMNEAYAALFEKARPQLSDDCPNILVTHCTVTGSVTCESESQITVGGTQQVSSDIFSLFDFTCLGHIHSPQKAGTNVYYSGSPLRYSFDVNERDKSMLLIDTDNAMSVQKIPIVPLREMRTVTGTFEELLSVEDNCSDDYIFAAVNDDHLIYEPMTRLREKYPNILGLSQSYLTRAAESGSDRDTLRERMDSRTISDEEIMISFLRDICKVEPSEEEKAFFNAISAGMEEDDN